LVRIVLNLKAAGPLYQTPLSSACVGAEADMKMGCNEKHLLATSQKRNGRLCGSVARTGVGRRRWSAAKRDGTCAAQEEASHRSIRRVQSVTL
jgi:hypothetical protein